MPIRILKIGIIVAILGIFFTTFVWPIFHSSNKRLRIINDEKSNTQGKVDKTYISEPYFKSKDSKGRLFIIKAEEGKGDKVVILKGINAEIELNNGKIFLKSNIGETRQDSDIIKLTGDVELYDKRGFIAKTTEATVNYKNKSAFGNNYITVLHNKGTITSNSFEILPEGNVFIFKNKVKVKVK